MIIAVYALLTILLIGWLIRDNITFGVTNYTLDSDKLTHGIKILQLSDLHGKQYGKNNERLLAAIRQQSPDIIVMTGDMLDENGAASKEIAEFFTGCCDVAATYYVLGNHEGRNQSTAGFLEMIKDTQVTVLNNRWCSITVNGDKLDIIGLNNYTDDGTGVIDSCIAESDGYKLLLDHYPEDYALTLNYRDKAIDLMLSGHAHGGQFRIPIINQPIFAPGQGLFPRYAQGLHRENGSALIVSRGLGGKSFPFRAFNQPEIVLITLQSSKQ